MTKDDILTAMNGIDEEYIEASERKAPRGLKVKTSLVLAAAMVILFSVTAVAAASFFNTVNDGEIVYMETIGGYTGDIYKVTFDIDVAEDAGYELEEYFVPMYLEENWVGLQGEAHPALSIFTYDNYEENWFAIFTQYPAKWETGNGGFVYSMPAGTDFTETFFEVDGEKIYCIEVQPSWDEYTCDPFGTRLLFWSDGYNFFSLETRLGMDDEILREIVRSVTRVDDITEYADYRDWEE